MLKKIPSIYSFYSCIVLQYSPVKVLSCGLLPTSQALETWDIGSLLEFRVIFKKKKKTLVIWIKKDLAKHLACKSEEVCLEHYTFWVFREGNNSPRA